MEENKQNQTLSPSKKPNRQKLRKERKAAKLKELEQEADEEIKNQVNMKEVESNSINQIISKLGFTIKEINYKDLREKAADYMKEHVDDFLPFVPASQDGEMCSLEQYQKYCNDLKNTAIWGGQLEILALSRYFQIPVHIVQMNSPILKVLDEEFPNKDPITLSFHRHMYGLGSHYNSLRTVSSSLSSSIS
nr:3391_t:CDS:2 [Entrophospora candida]CAG8558821.1 1094_t:CDS:2 [Entrophospora candida]